MQDWIAANPFRKWRMAQRRELREIEEEIDIPQNRVWEWEAGDALPTHAEMEELIKLSGITSLRTQWAEWSRRRPHPTPLHKGDPDNATSSPEAETGTGAERALVPWDCLSEFVDEEIRRCAELKTELSLLAVQLNTFETDDRGKHTHQDFVVHHLLRVIGKWLQPADELSHDGTGRFFLLLLRTPKARAAELAKSLLDQLQDDPVAQEWLGVDRLSVSLAVATYPEDGTRAAVLFEQIEKLLALSLSTARGVPGKG
jgi:diguanylate cyclase (GGDEF)-like protein